MVHVLFVDDEPDLHKIFQMKFSEISSKTSFAVETLGSAQDCLTHLSAIGDKETVLVISDINMPEMDGLGLLKVIQTRFPKVKVYICTAYDTPFYRKGSEEKGALRFFSKPLNFTALYGAIQEDFAVPLS